MENKKSIPPKLYRNMLADNYKQARNDYQKIREYYNKNNNPICQTDDRYIIPKTKGNILSQEYNKKMMEKPEKAHIKRIPIKDNLSSGVVVITEDNRAIGKNKGIFNGYHTLSTGKRNLGKKIVQENYKKFYFDTFNTSRLNRTNKDIEQKVSKRIYNFICFYIEKI